MKNTEFSKALLIQESILIWIITLAFIVLAFICVFMGFLGELPWLAAMVVFPWTAYGTSQAFYYKKAMAENTEGGIKFQSLQNEFMSESELDTFVFDDLDNSEDAVG